jgi:hypothetical protein
MVSSLEQALNLLENAKKEGREFCLALSGEGFVFWFSAGKVREVRGTTFEFSPEEGEPIFVTIDLKMCEFLNQEPSKPPSNFQAATPLSDVPVLQARMKPSGNLLELFGTQ